MSSITVGQRYLCTRCLTRTRLLMRRTTMPTRAAATTGNGRTADKRPHAPRSRAHVTPASSVRRLGSATADHAFPDPAGRCRLEILEAQLVATGRGDVAAF